MSGGNRAELVEQFIAITSADAAVANNLLEVSSLGANSLRFEY